MYRETSKQLPEIHLDWFTHDIPPVGGQICAIRPLYDRSAKRLVLSREESALMHALLNEVAKDESFPFGAAKQAVLRAFLRTNRHQAISTRLPTTPTD